jgi:hypothetical protein
MIIEGTTPRLPTTFPQLPRHKPKGSQVKGRLFGGLNEDEEEEKDG